MTTVKAPAEKNIIAKQLKRRHMLGAVYDLLSFDEETHTHTKVFVDDVITESMASAYMKVFVELGIVNRRLEYIAKETKGGYMGRAYYYRLNIAKDAAIRLLDVVDARELEDARRNFAKSVPAAVERRKERAAKTVETVAVRVEHDEPVEAIAGPEAPSPFAGLVTMRKNESYALVEAARQYRDRDSKVNERIEGLLAQAKEFGLTVDEAVLRSSISSPTDERLANVGLVLPYIEQLERMNARHMDQIEDLRKKISEQEKTQREIVALRDQNRRLMAKQVTN